MPARQAADSVRTHAAAAIGRESLIGLVWEKLRFIQFILSRYCRVLNTAGNTVEKGSVAYQKYDHGLNCTPT